MTGRFLAPTSIIPSLAPAKQASERIVRCASGPNWFSMEMDPLTRRRVFRGIASSPAVDTHRTSLYPLGCEAELPLPVLFEHGEGRRKTDRLEDLKIGEIHLLIATEDHLVVEGSVSLTRAGDAAWSLVRSGEARALSVFAEHERMRGSVDKVRFIDEWRLAEISICRTGSNDEALLVVIGDFDFEW